MEIIEIPEESTNNKKFTVDTESGEEKNEGRGRFKRSCLFYLSLLFFAILIGIGIYEFYNYDKKFNVHSEETRKAREDSLRRKEREKLSNRMAEEMKHDSILKAELKGVREADSLENVRALNELMETRRQDSIRVDTFMTHVIKGISKSNTILARYLDGKNYLYYFTDKLSSTYDIKCFDGVTKQVYSVISKLDGKYAGHYVSPDYKSLIILCANKKKQLGYAYKIDMSGNRYIEYTPDDNEQHQCYDLGCTPDGFYMKFGTVDKSNVKHAYTCYYDRYGNFVTQN